MMRSERQIKRELERVKLIEKEYEGCSIGTDGYTYWLDAFHLRQALEWVLCL